MSTKPPNIFISWSGPRSKHVATALNEWLPTVLQSATPWFSKLSIDKGARPLEEISSALDSIEVGVSCLTPENMTAPWILYEAGALSKRIGTKSRLCTYLLGGLTPEGVPPPLGMFQHTRADKEETRLMLRSINSAISKDPVPEPALDKLFERMWPDLEKDITSMPAPEKDVPAKRPPEDMLAEVLDILRSDSGRRTNAAQLETEVGLRFLSTERPRVSEVTHYWRPQPVSDKEWDASDPKCPICGSEEITIPTGSSIGKHCRVCGAFQQLA